MLDKHSTKHLMRKSNLEFVKEVFIKDYNIIHTHTYTHRVKEPKWEKVLKNLKRMSWIFFFFLFNEMEFFDYHAEFLKE